MILLVDDDPAHRMLAQRALTSVFREMPIETADSQLDAVNAWKEHHEKLRLIILDLNLQGQRSTSFLQMVSSSIPPIPVIMLSTSMLDEDVAQCYALGASAYVQKSVDVREFRVSLQACAKFFLRNRQ